MMGEIWCLSGSEKKGMSKSTVLAFFLAIFSNSGRLRPASSSVDVSVLADFYNETTVSRIAFGSCR